MKKATCRILVLSIIISLFSVTALSTKANAAFTIRSTAPSGSNGYYYSSKNPFYSAGFTGQCTWYAWGRAYEMLGSKPRLSTGNANAWYNYNKNNGIYPYGSSPKTGAIACWTGSGYVGHVAVVEEIDSSGTVWVSNSNHNHDGAFHYDNLSNIQVNGGSFQGYIYLPADGSSGSSTGTGEGPYTAYVTGTNGSLAINSVAAAGNQIGRIPEGSSCTVYPQRASGSWCWVEYNGVSGYAYGKYLTTTKPNTPADLSEISSETGDYTVTIPANYNLNCYEGPVATSVSRHISEKSSSYKLSCGLKVTLSDGTTRYNFFDGDGNNLYFIFADGMTVSEYVAPTPSPEPEKAATVSKPSVTSNGSSVTVSWTAVNNATSYDVYLVQAPWSWSDIKYQTHISVDADKTHTFTNVADGDYAAFVIARPNEDSAQSEWCYFTVKKAVQHKITFNASGGSVSVSSKNVTNGFPFGELPVPVKKPFLFDGWHLGSKTITAGTIVDIDSDCTLVAYWTMGSDSAKHFTDVPSMSWYYYGISNAVDNHLFDGTSSTTFDPYGTMTRAMFCKVMSRLMGATVTNSTQIFSDVPDGQWYSNYVNWAAQKGIVNGIGNGKFDPNAPISTEAVLTVLYRYSGTPAVSGNINDLFASNTSSWAKNAVIWADNRGIMYNMVIREYDEKNTFHSYFPNQSTTRAHVAWMLMNYMRS